MPVWISKILESILMKWLTKLAASFSAWIKIQIDRSKRLAEQKKDLDSYNDAVKNNLSEAEKIKRGEDLLNSGTKP